MSSEAKEMKSKCIRAAGALLYLIALILAVTPPGFAAVDTSGDGWIYESDSKTLTITGQEALRDYSASDKAPWSGLEIENAIISEGIKEIGANAFLMDDGGYIRNLQLSSTVNTIAENALDCQSMENIYTSSGNLVYRSIDGVLYSIGETEVIKYPSRHAGTAYTIAEDVMSIDDHAFYCCENLRTLNIPSTVTSLTQYGIFGTGQYPGVVNINVVKGNSRFSSIDGVLFSKDKKTLIRYPSGKTDEEYTIPEKVTSIGEAAFENCTSLQSVEFNAKLEQIGDAAFEMTGITAVEIPNTVKAIGDYSFAACFGLERATLPSFPSAVGINIFSGDMLLSTVTFRNGNVNEYTVSDNLCESNDTDSTIAEYLKLTSGYSGSLNELGIYNAGCRERVLRSEPNAENVSWCVELSSGAKLLFPELAGSADEPVMFSFADIDSDGFDEILAVKYVNGDDGYSVSQWCLYSYSNTTKQYGLTEYSPLDDMETVEDAELKNVRLSSCGVVMLYSSGATLSGVLLELDNQLLLPTLSGPSAAGILYLADKYTIRQGF